MSSSTAEQYNMPSTSADTIRINNKAVQRISFLEHYVHILTDQLRLKDSLLTEVLDISLAQSTALAQLCKETAKLSQTLSRLSVSALQDTSALQDMSVSAQDDPMGSKLRSPVPLHTADVAARSADPWSSRSPPGGGVPTSSHPGSDSPPG